MSEFSAEELQIARQYDLTSRIVPFLDRHVIYPILESLREVYSEQVVNQMEYDLFKETNMISFLRGMYQKLNGTDDLPEELLEKETKIEEMVKKFTDETEATLNVLQRPEVQENLKQDKFLNQEYLKKEYSIDESKIEKLFHFGQFSYNRGDYNTAAGVLTHFRAISTNNDLIMNATWGKLACNILQLDWASCLKELDILRDVVDSRSFANLDQLHNRTWIIHWSLFPFFNSDDGLDKLLSLFFSPSYISTIQAAAPWVLRYLVVAVVSCESSGKSSSKPDRLKELITVVDQEKYDYNDPLTDFIKALYIDFNFEEANLKLNEASVILKTDFFLNNYCDVFVENARHLISRVYCRVHHKINLDDFSKSLNLDKDLGEKWVADLIKETKMDAKIDESAGTVILNHPVNSVYQQVIEKTKGLATPWRTS